AAELGAPESISMSFVMNQLGMILFAKGLYTEAEPLIRKALEIEEKLGVAGSAEIAIHLTNLGMLLKVMGHLNDAEPLLRKAIEIFFGREEPHADRTKPLNALALVLMEGRRFQEAEMLLLRALALDEEAENQSSITVTLHNLALLLQATGRTAEAEPVIRRSLEVSKAFYGEDHPRTARKIQILAGIVRDLGRPDEAEPLVRQALEIFAKILGPDHPRTQSARHDLDTLTAA
ncbi:MAG TPA: tetratricopeptide repeat protein, partial [Thermoanaerobaculia bacterium]